jgi:hypothetical protein
MDKEPEDKKPDQSQIDKILQDANDECIEGTDDIYDLMAVDESATPSLNPLLTDAERELAILWAEQLDHGVILLHGPLRSGKGAIGNWISKYICKWCLDKHILMDYKPRPLYDLEYRPEGFVEKYLPEFQVPFATKPFTNDFEFGDNWGLSPDGLMRQTRLNLWNKKIFVNEIERMGDVAMGILADNAADEEKQTIDRVKADEVKRLTGLWLSTQGAVKMQRATLLLDELKRLHPKRNQLNPYGVHMIALYDLLGHLHLNIIGMTAYYNELDENQFLPKVTVEIKCHKAEAPLQHIVVGDAYKVRWVQSRMGREFRRLGEPIVLDGREPQLLLGNYVYSELAEDIPIGDLDLTTGIRHSPYIRLETTKGFRNVKGVAWVGHEYVGYENVSDENGAVWDGGYKIGEVDTPNALLDVTRRLNWKHNKCEPSAHQKGEPVWTGKGWFDIYNSWNSFGLPVTKGMKS